MTTTTTTPQAAATTAPVQTRSERPKSFDPADFATPTSRQVDFKYTPVAKLAKLFVDEPGDGTVQYEIDAPEGVVRAPLAPGEAPRGTALVPEDLPTAIAAKQCAEALHIAIPKETELDAPIRVRITGSSAEHRDVAHIVIHAERHSRAMVILEHTGSATYAENVEILLDDEAKLSVIALHEWADDTIHNGTHFARVGRGAALEHTLITFGGEVVRVNPTIHLEGDGAESEVRGLYFADSGQHFEHNVFVHHDGERTTTDVTYKGALQGDEARTVWVGDVLIGPDAVGTDSYEQTRNLILSGGARADSVPNLEIECGEIEGAGHASATGRFDEQQLFYLMARGLDERQARRLVVHGFLNEIVQKLGDEQLLERVTATLEQELERADDAIAALTAREAAAEAQR